MRKLLGKMDALKLMILVCFLACAGLAFWNFVILEGELEETRRSWRRAKSDVVQIHSLLKQISTLYRARDEQLAQGQTSSVFFENQISGQGGINKNAYTFGELAEKPVTIGRKKATDYTQAIDFRPRGKGERRFWPRNNIFVALYNCEAKSKRWKLRELKLRSKEDMDAKRGRDSGYPNELEDLWYIDRLVFASREPKGK